MGFYQDIEQQFGRVTVSNMKKWATTNIKLAKKTNRRIFLLRCRKAHILPAHIKNGSKNLLGLLDDATGRTRHEINEFNLRLGTKILNFEIKITINVIVNLQNSIKQIKDLLGSLIPVYIVNEFSKRLTITYNKVFKQVQKVNINKFNKLNASKVERKLFLNNDKWFINFSNVLIPDNIKNFLSLGHKFSIHLAPKSSNLFKLLAEVENLLEAFPAYARDQYRARITNIITNFIHSRSLNNGEFYQSFIECRHFLRQNDNLLILKADKGNVTVAMNRDDYNVKVCELLFDNNVYLPINRDPTFTSQKKVNDLLKTAKYKKHISHTIYKQLVITNSVTPKFYGLPKIHKPNIPLRPIVSSIDSPLHKLSKFLSDILTISLATRTSYNTKDTFTFVAAIRGVQLPQNFVLISLDVVSLFTNIPLELVVTIIEDKWSFIKDFCNFDLSSFITLIRFIFNNCYFSFHDRFYKQIFGTPMGSPLSPIIALITMDFILDNVLPKLSFVFPFLFKYVDDIICAVPYDKIDDVLLVFNSIHPKIQFTVEKETNCSVPFLDTKVIRNINNQILIDWYQKPTFSGRYLNFYSNHSINQKINVVIAMKNRVVKISDPTFLQKNLKILVSIFTNNGYPLSLINKLIYNSPSNVLSDPLPRVNENIIVYKKLPYIKNLTCHIVKLCYQENLKISQYNTLKLNMLFSKIKDVTPHLHKSNVVYKIPCKDCDKCYIGQTVQWLNTRLVQHKSDCNVNKLNCALTKHSFQFKHIFDFDNTKILEIERNYKSRIFLEMVHINKTANSINFRTDIQKLSSIYSYLLSL